MWFNASEVMHSLTQATNKIQKNVLICWCDLYFLEYYVLDVTLTSVHLD